MVWKRRILIVKLPSSVTFQQAGDSGPCSNNAPYATKGEEEKAHMIEVHRTTVTQGDSGPYSDNSIHSSSSPLVTPQAARDAVIRSSSMSTDANDILPEDVTSKSDSRPFSQELGVESCAANTQVTGLRCTGDKGCGKRCKERKKKKHRKKADRKRTPKDAILPQKRTLINDNIPENIRQLSAQFVTVKAKRRRLYVREQNTDIIPSPGRCGLC